MLGILTVLTMLTTLAILATLTTLSTLTTLTMLMIPIMLTILGHERRASLQAAGQPQAAKRSLCGAGCHIRQVQSG